MGYNVTRVRITMTEEDKSHLAILLPTATVALFSRDQETVEAFQSLESDWRFARVALEVHDGDVETATAKYRSSQTPELLIVQTEDIDSGFTDKLETLGEHCAETTSAIVIGPDNDVNLYRKLVGMGVSDYLVRPIAPPALADDIAETLIEQMGASGSRLIAFMGAKGGVGTTSLVEAVAWNLSTDLKQKTFLLDAAGGWSTLSVGMNFEPSTTIVEAARAASDGDEDSLSRMIHKAHEKLYILSSGGDVMLDDPVDEDRYEALLDYLMALYPVVLVDLSAAPAQLKRLALTKAQRTMLVTSPLLPAVRATRTLLHEIKQLRGDTETSVDIILNMKGIAPKHEVPKAQIKAALEQPISATIDFDPALFVSTESESKKLHLQKGGEVAITELMGPIMDILDIQKAPAAEEKKSVKGVSGLLDKLKSKS